MQQLDDYTVFGFEPDGAQPVDGDRRAFRRALGHFPTGVAIVTTVAGDRPVGMTINSFASVSLDPPLVLWSVDLAAGFADAFTAADRFALSVLAGDQMALARRFAADLDDRFDGVATWAGAGGLPLIAGALATFECRREAVHPGGDHAIIVGRVDRFAARDGSPLLFHAGHLAPLG